MSVALLQVAAKLRESVELLHKLQTLQDELLPVARRGALIYTVLRSLTSISPHYQFKLPQFLQMFYEAVGKDPSPDVFVEDDDDNLVSTPFSHLFIRSCQHLVMVQSLYMHSSQAVCSCCIYATYPTFLVRSCVKKLATGICSRML